MEIKLFDMTLANSTLIPQAAEVTSSNHVPRSTL